MTEQTPIFFQYEGIANNLKTTVFLDIVKKNIFVILSRVIIFLCNV